MPEITLAPVKVVPHGRGRRLAWARASESCRESSEVTRRSAADRSRSAVNLCGTATVTGRPPLRRLAREVSPLRRQNVTVRRSFDRMRVGTTSVGFAGDLHRSTRRTKSDVPFLASSGGPQPSQRETRKQYRLEPRDPLHLPTTPVLLDEGLDELGAHRVGLGDFR
jgi:hypothetical protein